MISPSLEKKEEQLHQEEEEEVENQNLPTEALQQQETTTTTTITEKPKKQAHGFTGLPLDWTQLGVKADDSIPLRYPQDVADWSKEEDLDICIVGTAGQKITQLPNDFYTLCHPQLETLILRSHMISVMKGLDGFHSLHTLEFYDNQIQSLENLEGCGPNLRILDFSFNSIRDMKPIHICTNLQELYLANNKLKSMTGLSTLVHLKKVDLGANRIRFMDEQELSPLVNLEELWIGKNKIEEIQGLEKLTKLRRLDVQSNRLTKIENLTTQSPTLEELYLSFNAITDEGASCPTGLALPFPNLNVVDLSRNELTSTEPFAHLSALEELWISGNKIATFDDILPLKDSATSGIQSIDTIYLEYNPVADEFEYRKRLKEYIPNLKQIDATTIGCGGVGTTTSLAKTIMTPTTLTTSETNPEVTPSLLPFLTPEQMQQAALDLARKQQQQEQHQPQQQKEETGSN